MRFYIGSTDIKDLIVKEARQGISGTTYITWLVSCKHFAHSGKSVSDTDELNILDRVKTHHCNGFMGFYSTLPATSLRKNLEGLEGLIETQSFDREKIEKLLFDSPEGMKLASRYFPNSFEKFKAENPKPVTIFSDDLILRCEYCNKNLLEEKKGVFVLFERISDENSKEKNTNYQYAYFSCKGECDHILKNKYITKGQYIDSWMELSDFMYPTGYLRKVMAFLNSFHNDNEKMDSDVFNKLKNLFLLTFPNISREHTEQEKERIKLLTESGYYNLFY